MKEHLITAERVCLVFDIQRQHFWPCFSKRLRATDPLTDTAVDRIQCCSQLSLCLEREGGRRGEWKGGRERKRTYWNSYKVARETIFQFSKPVIRKVWIYSVEIQLGCMRILSYYINGAKCIQSENECYSAMSVPGMRMLWWHSNVFWQI